jgi:acyl-coenzyme A thioesterase PaaI-like protein
MSRDVTHDGRGHTLMAATWNTEDTITHFLSLFRQASSSCGSSLPNTDLSPIGTEDIRAEVRRFYAFGKGLNAHPDLLHGGVIACVLDSTMGNVIGAALPLSSKNGMYTVQLNIRYEKPVRTPGAIMARAWVTRIEDGGRKVWVKGVVEGENIRHARAEGLWLSANKGHGRQSL